MHLTRYEEDIVKFLMRKEKVCWRSLLLALSDGRNSKPWVIAGHELWLKGLLAHAGNNVYFLKPQSLEGLLIIRKIKEEINANE